LSRDDAVLDRRHEVLTLTRHGQSVFEDLFRAAQQFDADLMNGFTEDEKAILKRCLVRIADL